MTSIALVWEHVYLPQIPVNTSYLQLGRFSFYHIQKYQSWFPYPTSNWPPSPALSIQECALIIMILCASRKQERNSATYATCKSRHAGEINRLWDDKLPCRYLCLFVTTPSSQMHAYAIFYDNKKMAAWINSFLEQLIILMQYHNWFRLIPYWPWDHALSFIQNARQFVLLVMTLCEPETSEKFSNLCFLNVTACRWRR